MVIHFDIKEDGVTIITNDGSKSSTYTIKHHRLAEELIKILEKEKIDLHQIKKVSICKTKSASFLNKRIATLFKNFVILEQKFPIDKIKK